tara:strand:- start:443 stop:622 length:180 start_codon:yes stop_codon:yes gene_type:complete
MIDEDFIAGFGMSILFVAVLAISYVVGVSFEARDITRSCKFTGTFVVQGVVYNCEVKSD